MIASNLEFQTQNLVTLYTRITPFVMGCAALVCIPVATGLVTFLLAIWFGVDRARDLRRVRRDDLAWSVLRSKLDSPGVIIGFPTAIAFLMLCFTHLFDARYTDLFAPPLAIAAGIKMAEIWRSSRWRVAVAALVAYQGVYAASMLTRYMNDSRKDMNAALEKVWQRRGTIYRHDVRRQLAALRRTWNRPGQGPWDADWISSPTSTSGNTSRPSGTFPFMGGPLSCREILYCDGERVESSSRSCMPGRDGTWCTCRRRPRGPRRSSCTTR